MSDRSDALFYLALIVLPVDGTVLGLYAPFWTPISPWLFLLYTAANWRELPRVYRRFRVWCLTPLVMVVLSALGWATVAFHPVPALTSLMAVVCAAACLTSLDIALRGKRLPWQDMVRTLIAAYWFAFAVGVVQWLAIRLDLGSVRTYFTHLMARPYGGLPSSPWGSGRPQFLFAEPSYIGMHLFGVLLPLMWMMRGRDGIYRRRLRDLIVVFSVGAVVMGAGVRIILDSLVALVIVIVERTSWHAADQRRQGIAELCGVMVLGAASMALNGRLNSIAANGMEGDGSFYARIWQSLAPLCGLLRQPIYLLTGYGAGNIADATHDGAAWSVHVLRTLRLDANTPAAWYARMTPDTVWTMSAYTSFLTEYGLIGLAVVIVLLIRHVSGLRMWNKTVTCWLVLVAYLYVQFEGYAFYAIPLFVWAVAEPETLARGPMRPAPSVR
ncbi:hypothetical protein [Bifidobacterium aerophilum]|uniref:O-antigen ligase domain-containing protein n=1 Tax=Bifidobacterium aerophilum TaxID=1798155 RepID=A0A6N9Z2R5_9BIFI|nr:hypothetical protein [Bifidobacterium aerophilum]NEG88766.1 hypothetical protein [Bifidobacterium aerophilum]